MSEAPGCSCCRANLAKLVPIFRKPVPWLQICRKPEGVYLPLPFSICNYILASCFIWTSISLWDNFLLSWSALFTHGSFQFTKATIVHSPYSSCRTRLTNSRQNPPLLVTSFLQTRIFCSRAGLVRAISKHLIFCAVSWDDCSESFYKTSFGISDLSLLFGLKNKPWMPFSLSSVFYGYSTFTQEAVGSFCYLHQAYDKSSHSDNLSLLSHNQIPLTYYRTSWTSL